MAFDLLERYDLRFPHSLPAFQRMFPNEAACVAYLERARWGDGFVCDHCGSPDEPYRFANRLGVCRCRHCNRDTSLTAGTVMERTHTPLSVWFWAAYQVGSQTPGMSAVQFQRQLGQPRYETAFQILHKLRSGMVLVAGAVELSRLKYSGSLNMRRTARYAGCVRLAVVPDRSAQSLGNFTERIVTPGATIVTDDWSGCAAPAKRG